MCRAAQAGGCHARRHMARELTDTEDYHTARMECQHCSHNNSSLCSCPCSRPVQCVCSVSLGQQGQPQPQPAHSVVRTVLTVFASWSQELTVVPAADARLLHNLKAVLAVIIMSQLKYCSNLYCHQVSQIVLQNTHHQTLQMVQSILSVPCLC